MANSINRLAAKQVKDAAPGERLRDGGGLSLQVGSTGKKSWLFVYRWMGRRPELGLGPYPDVGLADARRRAEEARGYLAEKPPREPRAVWAAANVKLRAVPTFGDFVGEWIELVLADFKNVKHRQQWRNTLATYAAAIWGTPIDQVDTGHVLAVLQPIWAKKRETAQRLRGRLERILDAAKARGFRSGENPARWRGHLSAVLSNQPRLIKHHPAMHYDHVPAFMGALLARRATSSDCLRFLILTSVRSGEARGATWNEIDFKSRVWTIPAARMKAAKMHRVPLSRAALDILQTRRESRLSDLLFPGAAAGRPLSETAVRNLVRRMGIDNITTHGFRSAFRDWCGEVTSFPREVAETALAHTVGDAVERAYRRGDALEKRRQLMDAWADHCTGDAGTKVVALHG